MDFSGKQRGALWLAAGNTESSARARILQSLLQNTLEQSMIAVSVYLCGATFLPAS